MSSNSNLYNKISLNPTRKTLPETLAPKTYKGFSTVSSQTENYNLFDFQLIQQDLLNHFHIRQGERLMNPTFGTVIWDLLFEPLTDDLKQIITKNVDNILNYDPRISASNIIITSYENGIQIECMLTFLPYNISQSMQLTFDQNNGLLVG
jgi:phage baseplate assembly protein W